MTDAIRALWIAWALLWLVLAARTKPAERRESLASRARHGVPVLAGAWLLVAPLGLARLDACCGKPAFHPMALLFVLAGLAYASWARLAIGSNWSGAITVKQNHELVRSGPYAHCRHPIYAGLLLALLGTAIAEGTPRAWAGAALIALGLGVKMRAEEATMRERFGEAYAAYCATTPRFILF